MNLKEVMQALIDGKILKYLSVLYIKINHNNDICCWNSDENKWVLTMAVMDSKCSRQLSTSETDPEAKYKKSLEPKYGALGFNKKGIDISGNGLRRDYCKTKRYEEKECSCRKDCNCTEEINIQCKKALTFQEALQTLIELKAHPLSVAAVDCLDQYNISMYGNSITTGRNVLLQTKLSQVSAFFYLSEHAEEAIKDIGEDRLISMFKVLQGVYE